MLTEASLASREDTLQGLKENVILGHLIPAGTGFRPYQQLKIAHLGAPVAEIEPNIAVPTLPGETPIGLESGAGETANA